MSYQQTLTAARQRLASLPRNTVEVPGLGAVEYTDDGTGPPALVSHPLCGGIDLGLGVGRKFLAPEFRVVSPSRFGYLGSVLPDAATPDRQADAFDAVLDALGLEHVLALGYSAGGPSVIQLALRHPERVSALVLVASALPGRTGAPPKPVANLLFGSDLVFWLLGGTGPMTTARILGMDRHFRPTGSQRDEIRDACSTMLPVAPRKRGVLHDLYVSNPDVQRYPVEEVSVPTLVISARDDAMPAYVNAAGAASRLPRSRLVSFEHGGHLLLGQEEAVRRSVAEFLET